jgi:hypothetical protein
VGLFQSNILSRYFVELTRVDSSFFFSTFFYLKLIVFSISSFDSRLLDLELFYFPYCPFCGVILGHGLVRLTRIISSFSFDIFFIDLTSVIFIVPF